jgi:hypothetical protein
MVYESLMKALKYPVGVSSDIVSDTNMKPLANITRRLSLRGTNEFVRKFRKIEGYDITVGDTKITASEFDMRQFCLQDLVGMDMRAVVPQAVNYLSTLPFYERMKFNSEFIKIFKLDLRNVAPYLFEHILSERKLIDTLTERIKQDFRFICRRFDEKTGRFVLDIAHNEAEIKMAIPLDADRILEFFSFTYGDMIEFCYSKEIGGLPASYTWDTTNNRRMTRVEILGQVKNLLYMCILSLMKDRYAEK